jgi:hypothetical protein
MSVVLLRAKMEIVHSFHFHNLQLINSDVTSSNMLSIKSNYHVIVMVSS